MRRSALATLLAFGLACARPEPAPSPAKAIQVQVTSTPDKVPFALGGQPMGETPRTIAVTSADELLKLSAAHGPETPVETRIRFLSLERAEVVFVFGHSPMAKVLGLPRILVFDYGAGVTFDLNKADLKPDFLPLLDRQARLLQNHFAGRDVFVCGHTDATGGRELNIDLSLNRARAVADNLKAKGVPRDRMKVQGFGSDFPVTSNDTEAGRALNRRTEVVLPQ